ncbi:CPBP family intramembrane glutamic endopeptidase, BDIM_20840 family [Rhizorhabdus phycosphaerae]|uniref:CPBP family intramembrane glutamic endopeptidase, BDIM_20840 family n=1 Tax=Rhizorhabdus phycosphaerae TaxID=2711156 RepID=UPI0013EBC2F8|nr:CPBP family intramembrane glutamic endopeptidase [Rhizorhabdus phycosphaerae]
MNGLIGLGGTLAIFLALGMLAGSADHRAFSLRWLLVAALLVAVNDALLTNLYGLLPDLIGGAWNWQGKLMAAIVTSAIVTTPAFGWRRAGFTLSQEPGSLRAALPVAAFYCAFFVIIAMIFPADPSNGEDVAFQLTMPGLEEELFYRGLLLCALDRAFAGRTRFFGVDWGWGAVLSCLLFGMAHAFGFSHGGFGFDPATFALTAIPSFLAVWLRLRTGSLVLPVLLHNFGNAFSLII